MKKIFAFFSLGLFKQENFQSSQTDISGNLLFKVSEEDIFSLLKLGSRFAYFCDHVSNFVSDSFCTDNPNLFSSEF